MEAWKQYILSIVAAAMICGILSGLLMNTRAKALVKMVCGVFLAVTLLHPLSRIDADFLTAYDFMEWTDAEKIVSQGEKIASEARAERIKAECEAYILDRANAMDAVVTAQVSLDENQIPVFARIRGEYTSLVQQNLSAILESDLGITKENQLWIGMQENSIS